jgi:hypothetical protein
MGVNNIFDQHFFFKKVNRKINGPGCLLEEIRYIFTHMKFTCARGAFLSRRRLAVRLMMTDKYIHSTHVYISIPNNDIRISVNDGQQQAAGALCSRQTPKHWDLCPAGNRRLPPSAVKQKKHTKNYGARRGRNFLLLMRIMTFASITT